ncbi:phage tail tape measure protein [Escherichia coli]|uniref:Phage tail tape measure protein n=1 Tax=Escherichia coli TaxID=562 RepID=A0A376JQU1_ECOLX|nr:phage tail tape measure protein [Escherichia coli]
MTPSGRLAGRLWLWWPPLSPGALLIRKYWEPVSAFFGGVVEGLKAAFAPVGELFHATETGV